MLFKDNDHSHISTSRQVGSKVKSSRIDQSFVSANGPMRMKQTPSKLPIADL